MNMIQVCFKLCYTSKTVSYTVPCDQKMSDFYDKMKEDLRRDLSIEGDFYILPGPELQYKGYEACPEDHPPVLTDDVETVEEYCNRNETNTNMFYVRLDDS